MGIGLKRVVAIAGLLWGVAGTAVTVSAQTWEGVVDGGVTKGGGISPVTRAPSSTVFLASGTVLYSLWANGTLAAGGQADVLVSLPYAAARGGPVAQVTFKRPGWRVQPFFIAGVKYGEEDGVSLGGGVELGGGTGKALRMVFEDVPGRVEGFHEPGFTYHRPSLRIGIAWR